MQQNFLCPVCWKENTADSTICSYCRSRLGLLGAINSRCAQRGCNWPRVPNDRFCGNCGYPLQPICPNCANNLSRDSRYCPKCSFFCGGGREGLT